MKAAILTAIVTLLITTWNSPILLASAVLHLQVSSEPTEVVRKKAEAGDVQAQLKLGRLYDTGTGVPIDRSEAARWYRRAAERGSSEAQLYLGNLYYMGDGVPQDYKEAGLWYREAAEQGNAQAQHNIGFMCQHYTVPPDLIEAYKWYELASAQGHQEAIRKRRYLRSQMTPAQIAEAQMLARAFVAVKQDSPPPASAPPRGSSGTGFFVTTNGYLVTSHHVVDGATSFRVVTPAGTNDARLILSDTANDIALLKVDGSFAALAVRSSRGIRMGDTVETVGFPNPSLQGFAPKFSNGVISALTGAQDDPRFFQISVPVQPGNSGGALADSSGNVIGVITAKLGLEAAVATSGAIPENVNYALKSSFLVSLLESVPGLADRLKPPATAPKSAQQVAAELEKATVLVVAY